MIQNNSYNIEGVLFLFNFSFFTYTSDINKYFMNIDRFKVYQRVKMKKRNTKKIMVS